MSNLPERWSMMEKTITLPVDDHALLAGFVEEACVHLEGVRRDLLTLETGPGDRDLIHRLFRAFHTIKGTAGCLRLSRIEALAHETEHLLARARESEVPVSAKLAGEVLEAVRQMWQLLDGLNSTVPHTSVRPDGAMLPGLLQEMSRLAHDVARQAGKEVEVVISAAPVPLQRHTLEPLRQALIHLVRNSIDHGIELPADRHRVGKPRRGRIEISGSLHHDDLQLQIADDGRGLDTERILARARQANLVPAGKALTEQQAWPLIFTPGLTTADAASRISGRGVGMDVVRRNIEQLGGCVDVTSTAGRRTAFTIRLPR